MDKPIKLTDLLKPDFIEHFIQTSSWRLLINEVQTSGQELSK